MRGVVAGLALLAFGGPAAAQSVPADHVRSFFAAVRMDDETAPHAASVGATWGRLGIRWWHVQPERSTWDFARFDRAVEATRAHGVRLLPILNTTAVWASSAPEGAEHPHRYPAADEEAWRRYVATVVERYPDIEYFEVWNEPNIDWFFRADENHREYVDRVLIPAAEEIHARGRKVVAPSYTLEWPFDAWPLAERPGRHPHNLASVVEDVDRWLSYNDAWRHVDVLSVHYSKGDTKKPTLPFADDLMPFWEHVRTNWIDTGRLEGVWNTEEGLTAVEAGTAGFVSMEPWETEPYAQWVARYFVPVLHWALGTGWEDRDAYKVFWYNMGWGPGRQGTLEPTRLLRERDDDALEPSETGRAMGTLVRLLTDGRERVGRFGGDAVVGLGLHSADTASISYFTPYHFPTYAFTLDDDLLLVAWLDLPGLDRPREEVSVIEATVEGLPADGDPRITVVDYVDGIERPALGHERSPDGTLRIRLPRTSDPVLYLKIEMDGGPAGGHPR